MFHGCGEGSPLSPLATIDQSAVEGQIDLLCRNTVTDSQKFNDLNKSMMRDTFNLILSEINKYLSQITDAVWKRCKRNFHREVLIKK